MSLLDLYIGRTIVHQALVVMAVLVGLFSLVMFIDQIADIGSGDYGVMRAFVFVGLSVPRIVYEVFPMATLLGAILGLSSMARDSELIVIRASGISVARMTLSALKFGAFFVLVAILIGELVKGNEEINGVPVLTRISNAKFKREVRPGDTIEIRAALKEQLGSAWFLKGSVRVGGKIAVKVEFACALKG